MSRSLFPSSFSLCLSLSTLFSFLCARMCVHVCACMFALSAVHVTSTAIFYRTDPNSLDFTSARKYFGVGSTVTKTQFLEVHLLNALLKALICCCVAVMFFAVAGVVLCVRACVWYLFGVVVSFFTAHTNLDGESHEEISQASQRESAVGCHTQGCTPC